MGAAVLLVATGILADISMVRRIHDDLYSVCGTTTIYMIVVTARGPIFFRLSLPQTAVELEMEAE